MKKGSRKINTLKKIEERFLAKVQVRADGCHEWIGAKQSNGYGRFNPFGKSMYAHRFSALLKYGLIHHDFDICHSCDNRNCVNPEHLFIGSRKDNMQDCQKKGRTARGSKLSKKLKDEDVIQIRKLYQNGIKNKELAKKFGVTHSNIRKIVTKETWRHI